MPTYNIKVDMHNVRDASMVHFDFFGTVELEIVKNESTVENLAPGIHYIEDYIAYIPSGKTVYIAGGAAVVGSIHSTMCRMLP